MVAAYFGPTPRHEAAEDVEGADEAPRPGNDSARAAWERSYSTTRLISKIRSGLEVNHNRRTGEHSVSVWLSLTQMDSGKLSNPVP